MSFGHHTSAHTATDQILVTGSASTPASLTWEVAAAVPCPTMTRCPCSLPPPHDGLAVSSPGPEQGALEECGPPDGEWGGEDLRPPFPKVGHEPKG